MKDTPNITLRRQFLDYLAQRLPEEDCARFEERLLADQEFSDMVAALEFQLLDEQASGTLNVEEAAIVKKWTDASAARQTSARISSLLVSSPLIGTVPQRAKTRRKAAVIFLLAASVTIAASLMLWHLQRTAFPSHIASASRPPANLAALSAAVITPDTVLLVTQRLRGGEDLPLVYHLHHDTPIRLQLLTPESSPDATYTLRISKTGDKTFQLQRLNIAATSVGGLRYVEVLLPGNALPPARYTAMLIGHSGNLATSFLVQWK